jgi:hypothetical protein
MLQVNKHVQDLIEQESWCRSEVLPDAAAHPEHGLLIRCNFWPRSVEGSRDDWTLFVWNICKLLLTKNDPIH